MAQVLVECRRKRRVNSNDQNEEGQEQMITNRELPWRACTYLPFGISSAYSITMLIVSVDIPSDLIAIRLMRHSDVDQAL